jgi:flagellar assembly protein FliH
MTYRMDIAGPPFLIWRFPELESAPNSAPTPASGEDADVNEMPATDAGNDPIPKGGGPSTTEMVEAQIAKGYAEGWQRGLAEGRERGYAEGVEAGTKAAAEALAARAERLDAIITRLTAPLPVLERKVEEAVTALALEVARCVIGSETSRSREYLVRLIREAVAKVPIEMGALKVVLNPADLELIRALAPEIENGGAALLGDDAVEPGDCLVVADGQGLPIKDMRWRPRTGNGMSQVDLSLATRWRAVMLALFEDEDK